MSFYNMTHTKIQKHAKGREEFLEVGAIRYIPDTNIVYQCVEIPDEGCEGFSRCNSYSYSRRCACCIFGGLKYNEEDCKLCDDFERPDGKDVIFRRIKL